MNKIYYTLKAKNVNESDVTEKEVYVESPFPEDVYLTNLCQVLHKLNPVLDIKIKKPTLLVTMKDHLSDIDLLHRAAINTVFSFGLLPVVLNIPRTPHYLHVNNVDLFHLDIFMTRLRRRLLQHEVIMDYSKTYLEPTNPYYPGYNVITFDMRSFKNARDEDEHFKTEIAEIGLMNDLYTISKNHPIVIHIKWIDSFEKMNISVLSCKIDIMEYEYKYPIITMMSDLFKINKFAVNVTYNAGIYFVEVEPTKKYATLQEIANDIFNNVIFRIEESVKHPKELCTDGFLTHCVNKFNEESKNCRLTNVYITNEYCVKDLVSTLFLSDQVLNRYVNTIMCSSMGKDIKTIPITKDGNCSTINIEYNLSLTDGEKSFRNFQITKELHDVCDVDNKGDTHNSINVNVYGYASEVEALHDENGILAVNVVNCNGENQFDVFRESLLNWLLDKYPNDNNRPEDTKYGSVGQVECSNSIDGYEITIRIYPKCGNDIDVATMLLECENHIHNFKVLNKLKKDVEYISTNHTYDFSNLEILQSIDMFYVKAGVESIFFIEESISDKFKHYVLDTIGADDSNTHVYFVPRFVIKLLNEHKTELEY